MTDLRLMHHANVAAQRTFMTLFGQRVYFYVVVKNRRGPTGQLFHATGQVRSELANRGVLLLEEEA